MSHIFIAFLLQCGHLVSSTLNTLHIIGHHRGGNIMNLLAYLTKFLSRCIHWVAHVGKEVLNRKGLPVEYFANNVSSGSVPLDTLGLLCIARNWHIHICVFLENEIWTTHHDCEDLKSHLSPFPD